MEQDMCLITIQYVDKMRHNLFTNPWDLSIDCLPKGTSPDKLIEHWKDCIRSTSSI